MVKLKELLADFVPPILEEVVEVVTLAEVVGVVILVTVRVMDVVVVV
jgi:hypothetical protein